MGELIMYDKIAEECRDKICDLQQKRMDEEFEITTNTARQIIKEYILEAIEKSMNESYCTKPDIGY